MINRRLLIKNLLAHHDESSFYDKKRQLNLHTKEGKAKFLKHICALSNSNLFNNSYIVVGVEDHDNELIGDDFFDDSRIQNLVNAYLENPPEIQYENVPFPNLPKDKVIGLVTIKKKKKSQAAFFKKNIHTITANTRYIRIGSNSIPYEGPIDHSKLNKEIVGGIENISRNNIAYTLDGVLDFINISHKNIWSKHKVFKELFVICWAGIQKKVGDTTYLSRVDIELINEQIKLFYSALDVVTIAYDLHSFTITEFVPIEANKTINYYPLEKQTLHFFDNGFYKIEREMLFNPPAFDKKILHHVYNTNLALLKKLAHDITLTTQELLDLENLPSTFMICYFNGFDEAKHKLIDAKSLLKPYPSIYLSFKESLRILRKMKYDLG
ncbi:MAG: ATP-binding protein [Flavobacterium psychrophilum]|jgi:hypothetical protein